MQSDVVVTGMGIVCCAGKNKGEVIKTLLNNESKLGKLHVISTKEFDTHIGGEVDINIDKGERSWALAKLAFEEAIKDSKIDEHNLESSGLIYGTCNGGIRSIEKYDNVQSIPRNALKNYPFNVVADKLARKYDLSGMVQTINTACAASGNAIGVAYDQIHSGNEEVMIAGGADAMSKAVYAGFNSLRAMSSKKCAPYDLKNGLNLGEGAAFVVLESKDLALKRDAKIYAQIDGYGLSNDAYHPTAPDVNGYGVALAVKRALKNSNLKIADISYINTHGTGTLANDGAELKGLKKVFGTALDKIAISSSKGYFGHNLGAAAAIEFVSTLLMLTRGYYPATLNFTKARADCEGYNLITDRAQRIVSPLKHYLVNNSAFGGHNCSIACSISIEDRSQSNGNDVSIKKPSHIYITDYSSLIGNKLGLQNEVIEVKNSETFSLKRFRPDLYKRRMNQLTQNSISAVSVLSSVKLQKSLEDTALIIGTQYGSLESATKYLNTIWQKGFNRASSIYFPDMVLNSTAGRIHTAFGIKGYATSISTGGNELLSCILTATAALKNEQCSTAIIGSGGEASMFEKMFIEKNDYIGPQKPYFEAMQIISSRELKKGFIEIKSVKSNFGNRISDIVRLFKNVDISDALIVNMNKSVKERDKTNFLVDSLFHGKYEYQLKNCNFDIIRLFKNSNKRNCVLLNTTTNGNNILIQLRK